jgi:hypothetical protein
MIRGLLLFLLILAVIHIGYTFASPVIKNKMLEGKMKEVAKTSPLKRESQLRHDVMEFVYDKGIPLEPGELIIERHDQKFTIAAHYKTHARFWFYERYYEFYPASHPSAALSPRRSRSGRAVHAGN